MGGFGEDDPVNEFKKSLDRFEQKVNVKYNQVIDQLNTLARQIDIVMTRQAGIEHLLKIRTADAILTVRDIALINAELTQLQTVLTAVSPEFKEIMLNARQAVKDMPHGN